MKTRSELVFWFETPPKISKGAFNHVSRVWGNRVLYLCRRDVTGDRKAIKWNDGDFGAAEVIMLSDMPDPDAFIRRIFSQHKDAIHIVNGFDTDILRLLKKHIGSDRYKIVFHSEKPTPTHLGIKGLCQRAWIAVKYRIKWREYRNHAKAVITFGTYGKRVFESFGWEADKVFNYMYCPVEKKTLDLAPSGVVDHIRFLYVGRFNFRTRALDVLMKAVNELDGPFHLTLVGGYGEEKDEVIRWAEAHDKVTFAGRWPSDEVGLKMRDFDVYLAPTRADGWNVQVNEALHAGIGVITTDEAVSDELVTASGAGIVIPANDPQKLAEAMLFAAQKPEVVLEWKKKARAYAPRISSESVGNYFMEILDHLFSDTAKERPTCPWL